MISYVKRRKRAVNDRVKSSKMSKSDKNQEKVKFYNSVDEINEDTLKNNHSSGTLEAKRFPMLKTPQDPWKNIGNTVNLNESNLQIKENQNSITNSEKRHGNDLVNKTVVDNKMKKLVKDRPQTEVNKNLSKIIVHELNSGSEIIGDKIAPVVSNITFKPKESNDTLTAMAYIAGNLLNKLWSMEKASSESSIEIETMKKKKILDLLELFKDPLSVRQETFLRNALEKLSEAIVNHKDNVSICSEVDLRSLSDDPENLTTDQSTPITTTMIDAINAAQTSTSTPIANPEVVSKLKDVLELIARYKEVSKNLHQLKQKVKASKSQPDFDQNMEEKLEEKVTEEEKESLNTFGDILEKVTKLLIPDKTVRKDIINNLNSQNMYKNANPFVDKINDLFKTNTQNLTIGSKDKLLADYLEKLQNSPKCVIGLEQNLQDTKIDGDILSKLSEFLKIKSPDDLLKVLEKKETNFLPSQKIINKNFKINNSRRKNNEVNTSSVTLVGNKTNDISLTQTKEKLKQHLKSIIQDLVEIKNAKGVPTKVEDFKLADLLPCVYNLLNDKSNKKMFRKINTRPVEAIKQMFLKLRNNTNAPKSARRMHVNSNHRPLSSIVLERVVKNLDKTLTKKSRRSMSQDKPAPKSFEDLKQMIEFIQKTNSDPLKKKAINGETSPSERVILLKALIVDVEQYRSILNNIKNMLDSKNFINENDQKTIQEFLTQASQSIYLSGSVIRSLEAKDNKQSRRSYNIVGGNFDLNSVNELKNKDTNPKVGANIRISRDDLINQLIKNKMENLIKNKEKNPFSYEDISVGIAKEILRQLENSNYGLARDLYKQFISRNPLAANNQELLQSLGPQTRFSVQNRDPLSSLDYTKFQVFQKLPQTNAMTPDFLLKQLIDLKNNMKV